MNSCSKAVSKAHDFVEPWLFQEAFCECWGACGPLFFRGQEMKSCSKAVSKEPDVFEPWFLQEVFRECWGS